MKVIDDAVVAAYHQRQAHAALTAQLESALDALAAANDERPATVLEGIQALVLDCNVEHERAQALTAQRDALLEALKGLLAVTPDCEGDYVTDSRGNFVAKAVGLGAACREARAAIAGVEGA